MSKRKNPDDDPDQDDEEYDEGEPTPGLDWSDIRTVARGLFIVFIAAVVGRGVKATLNSDLAQPLGQEISLSGYDPTVGHTFSGYPLLSGMANGQWIYELHTNEEVTSPFIRVKTHDLIGEIGYYPLQDSVLADSFSIDGVIQEDQAGLFVSASSSHEHP